MFYNAWEGVNISPQNQRNDFETNIIKKKKKPILELMFISKKHVFINLEENI